MSPRSEADATEAMLAHARVEAERHQAGSPAQPRRGVAVLTCMDSRIDPARLLGLAAGDAHVIRNAGGAVTDDAIRSLMISQRLLGTREVVVIQHTDCGMAKFDPEQLRAELARETGVEPLFDLHAFDDLEENLRRSLDRLRGSRLLPNRAAIRGFVFDVETGRLSEVAPGHDAGAEGL